jgi:hypothetical protein
LNLAFRDFAGEDPRDAHAIVVHVEHDADCILLVAVKDGVKDLNDKLPGSVIIIVHENRVQPRTFELFLGFDLRDGPGIVL